MFNLLELDKKIFLTLNGYHHDFMDSLMLAASNLVSFVPVFLLCAFIAIKYFKKWDDSYHPYLNLGLLVVIIGMQYFICRNLLEDAFKFLFYRDRPCENPDVSAFIHLLGRDCYTSNHSFFSYKSCLIFCITSFLFFTVKQGFVGFKIILVLWSILVAYSRIYVGAHYPVNILVSIVTGIIVGYLINRFYFYIKFKLLVI